MELTQMLPKLAEALWELNPQEREVVILRYYKNIDLKEIAKQKNAEERIVQIMHDSGIRKLEHIIPQLKR